jgi:hypothetical protein
MQTLMILLFLVQSPSHQWFEATKATVGVVVSRV